MKKPEFKTLLEEARKLGVDYVGKNRDDLFFELAGKSDKVKGVGVYDRPISEEEYNRRILNKEMIPAKTIYPLELEDKVLSVIAENPYAFNGYDFTRKDNIINFSFDNRKVKCYCGKTFNIERNTPVYVTRKDGGKERRVIDHYENEAVELRECPNPACMADIKAVPRGTVRKWIYIKTSKDG